MILTVRITSKGQVTIPKTVRERSGLLPGTDVEFVIDGEDVKVRRSEAQSSRGELLVQRLRRAGGDYTMSTDEVMALTRGED